jgi:hypothetical protein
MLKQLRRAVTIGALTITSLITNGCGNAKRVGRSITIDNPTDQSVDVVLDGKTIQAAAKSESKVEIKPGVHTINSASIGPLQIMVYPAQGTENIVINPTFATYVQIGEVYLANQKDASGFGPARGSVTFDGVTYDGPFNTKTGLFIAGNWSYGVHEPFPKSITRYGNEKGEIQTKLFSQKEFVDYATSENGQVLDTATPPDNTLGEVTFATHDRLPIIRDATVDAATADMRKLYDDYLGTTDLGKISQLRKKYFAISMTMVGKTAALQSSLSEEDRGAYNALVQQSNDLLSTPIRVLPNN